MKSVKLLNYVAGWLQDHLDNLEELRKELVKQNHTTLRWVYCLVEVEKGSSLLPLDLLSGPAFVLRSCLLPDVGVACMNFSSDFFLFRFGSELAHSRKCVLRMIAIFDRIFSLAGFCETFLRESVPFLCC